MDRLFAQRVPDEADTAPAAPAWVPDSQGMPEALMALQGTAGNAAVNRLMIQRQALDGGEDPDAGGGLGSAAPQIMDSSSTMETLDAFATNSAELTPAHRETLDRIAADLNAQPLVFGGYVTLMGYADRRGDPGKNQDLGQRRADAVREYLQQQVTDEDTRQQIRAYSMGAPAEGPVADDPSLRKVEISITRRSYHMPLPTPPLPWPSGGPSVSLPDIFRVPPSQIPMPDPRYPQLPDWFWRELPPRPPDPSAISQISRWLNESLHTHDIARVAADVAGVFGFDRAQVQRTLDDAFQSGGEAAVKEILNQMIQAAAGPPSSPPSSPYGPPVEPIPFPTPQLQLPPIPF
jgi:outer membrane protein OmpA-like peptidoglycan-associated protein